jgi:hypothetical protein
MFNPLRSLMFASPFTDRDIEPGIGSKNISLPTVFGTTYRTGDL